MSYICEFCGIRPENCACSVDLTEPRLETELAVADNIMAAENQHVQRPYGLLDAPSPADFFSLLVEMEKAEDYESNQTPAPNNTPDEFPPPPKLERQTNRPIELQPSEDDLNDVAVELFPEELIPDADFSEFIVNSYYCETCEDFKCDCGDQLAREDYETDRECVTYKYYRFCHDFPEETSYCTNCGKKYFIDESQYGMCYDCEMEAMKQDLIDQELYPDDIPMELRYNSDRDSF
jgi:hypothetical protein